MEFHTCLENFLADVPSDFEGQDDWMARINALKLADGEILGKWRVVDYNPEADEEDGR